MMKRSSLLMLATGAIIGSAFGLVLTPFVATEAHPTVALWLEVVHRVCTSIGGLGTFVALVFVMRQFNLLHAQSELVQKNTLASINSQLYARLDSFNKFIVEHDTEYEMLNKDYASVESIEHRYRLHHLCDLGFTFYEEIFKHHVRYGLLDSEDWEEWQQNMMHFFSKPYVCGYWPTVCDRYARSFRTFSNDLLAGMATRNRA
jgi:hypothetical protein